MKDNNFSIKIRKKYPDLNVVKTAKKARQFLEYDFQRIRRYADYESLISSPVVDGQPKANGFTNPDHKYVKLVSNRQKLKLIIKAMDSCSKNGGIILKDKYANNTLAYITYSKLNLSSATYSRYLNDAFVEFADGLYFLTKVLGDECIDLRVSNK